MTSVLNHKRVFVAGATGLAGVSAVRALLEAAPDVEIVAPHRGSDGAFIDDPRVRYVTADLRDLAACVESSAGCDMAVLAAANTGGAKASATAPWAQVTPNVVMDANLLDALHTNGVRRAVYVSTASVYQPFDGLIAEDELDWSADPHETYFGVGWAKRYGEKACEFWSRKTGLQVIILRLSNIYGPFARFDPEMSNFVPAIIRKAVDEMSPFEVWGSPDVTRDVIYADDFGAAVVAALSRQEIEFGIFNIGSGVRVTVGDVVRVALDSAGHTPSEVVFGQSAPSALTFRALDVSRAASELGWRAQVDIESGVRRTVAWWQGHRGVWTR